MQQSTIKNFTLVSSSRSSIHTQNLLSCSLPQRHNQYARRKVRVRAQQQQQQQQAKPEVAKFADSVGLPTEEGLFGFKPFPEVRQRFKCTSACCLLDMCRDEMTGHCSLKEAHVPAPSSGPFLHRTGCIHEGCIVSVCTFSIMPA